MQKFLYPLISLSLVSCIQIQTPATNCDTAESAEITDVDDIPTPSNSVNDDSSSGSSSGNSGSSQDNNNDSNDNSDAPAETREYAFSDADSLLYVQVYKDTSSLASDFAHNHVMRATSWDGTVRFNQDDISKCQFDFYVPVLNLQVDEDAMREFVGYGDTISTDDRDLIREHMLESNQLNAGEYDFIYFESSSCAWPEANRLEVTGDMFIAGSTREMVLNMNIAVQGNEFYSSGVIDFNHSDFNITPYSAFWGAVQNSQPLKITFDMVGFSL